MKYIYMISIILSSFFIYNKGWAQTSAQQYAFFIPGGAFQQNQQVQDIRLMRPRYAKTEEAESNKEETTTSSSTNTYSQDLSTENISTNAPTPQISARKKASRASSSKRNISTLPLPNRVVESAPINNYPQAPSSATKETTGATTIVFQDEQQTNTDKRTSQPVSQEVTQKLEQYQLEENTKLSTPQEKHPKKSQLSSIEQLKQKSLSSLLANIPYPDSSQPKFKQLYPYYGLELRVYQRRGKFPSNREQEEALAKANSIKRFDVK